MDKVGELWPALAINEGQTDVGGVRKDYKDAKGSFNCVIPYGDWEGGDVLLWDLRKRVEVKGRTGIVFSRENYLTQCMEATRDMTFCGFVPS